MRTEPVLLGDDGVLKVYVLDDRTGLRLQRVSDGQTAVIHTSPEIMERVRVYGLKGWRDPTGPMSDADRAFARGLLGATKVLLARDRPVGFSGRS